MKALSMFLIAGLMSFAAHAQEAPDALIKRVASDVVATLKSDKDIQAGNKKKLYDLVDGKIATNFNFTRMTALAMGRNWSKATPEQQKALAEEFKVLLIRTYSGALSNYQNHVMDFKPQRMQPADTDVRAELNSLVTRLASCGAGCAADRTKTIAKAACATVLGSGAVLIK